MNIVFFIRAYNDIDTVVPVAYKLLKTKAADSVCIVNQGLREDHERDFRIEFLRTVGEVRYVDAAGRSGLNPCCGKYDLRELSRRWRPASVLYNRLVLPVVESRRQEALDGFDFSSLPLAPGEPTVFLFDYNKSTLTRRGCEFARSKGFATGFLPHAVRAVDSRWLLAKEQTCGKGGDAGGDFEPDVFFSNNANFSIGLPVKNADKIKEVGSPRYCREWSEILDEITPRPALPDPREGILRICVMPSKFQYDLWKEATIRIFKYLASRDDVFTIIKPHTRGTDMEADLGDAKNIMLADPGMDSRRIIEWGDVTLFWKSSIFLDAVLLDKPLLHVRYALSSRLACDHLVKGWNLDSYLDVADWVDRLVKDRKTRTYTPEERQACLDFYVDDARDDVLDRNADAIVRMGEGAGRWQE